MLDDTYGNQDTTDTPLGQITPGEPVYDVNGDKVGTVSEDSPQGSYFIVRKGIIFTHDLYVPISAVTRSDADGIYLSLAKDDINNQSWDNPPATGVNTETPYTGTGATPGYGQGQDLGAQQAGTWQNTGNWTQQGATQSSEVNVPVREEELIAQKERGQTGQVHLHKDVVEERQTMDVPVTHEEVRVERMPVDDQQAAGNLGPDAFTEKDIDVPLMGEQVNVEKQARIGEEVRLHKQPVTEQQQISGTVRKEQVRTDGVDGQDTLASDSPDQPTTLDAPQP